MFQNHKLLAYFALWSVFIIVICDVAAGKLTDFFGLTIPVTVYFFPLIYIISDVLTEVYGYAVARRVLWCTIAARIGAALIFYLVAMAPAAEGFAKQEAYEAVLGVTPQIAIGGVIALFTGDSVNNFVMAKMKILTKGEYQPARLIGSTLAGEFAHTTCFYTIGLWGILPLDALVAAIITGTLLKTLWEVVLLPLTVPFIRYVKKVEGVDHYDTNTNFNPFKL